MRWAARIVIQSVTISLISCGVIFAQSDDCNMDRSFSALNDRDIPTAIHVFEAALETCADSLIPLKMLATLQLNRFSEDQTNTAALKAAEQYAQRASALAPDDPDLPGLLAHLRLAQGDYPGSEAIFLKLLEQSDLSKGAYANLVGSLGIVYLQWKKYDLAEAKLKEALKEPMDNTFIPSDRLTAYANLAQLYEQTGRKEEALHTYEDALDFARQIPPYAMDFAGGIPYNSAKVVAEMESRVKELHSTFPPPSF